MWLCELLLFLDVASHRDFDFWRTKTQPIFEHKDLQKKDRPCQITKCALNAINDEKQHFFTNEGRKKVKRKEHNTETAQTRQTRCHCVLYTADQRNQLKEKHLTSSQIYITRSQTGVKKKLLLSIFILVVVSIICCVLQPFIM